MIPRVKLFVTVVSVVWFTYLLYVLSPRRTPQIFHSRANFKYVLLWTPKKSPFNLIDEGISSFISNNCTFMNCYVTDNKSLLADLKYFDAVAFNGKDLTKYIDLPPRRSHYQKYIFVATESSQNYPVCHDIYENFFNWTWTYKLDSDLRWGYISIYDMDDRIVGPSKDMHWPEMQPVDAKLKNKLSGKSKMAAWFVSNCVTVGKRQGFYVELLQFLPLYNWTIDVYGKCSNLFCPRSNGDQCNKMIEDDYHFYFSFENSFSEDYVTEKLLTALNHYAIPVVYGGANYSRFLPPGSYLNANELGAEKLMATMNEIYNNKTKFYEYFRWRNYYKYKSTIETDDLCNLCTALNDEKKVHTHSVHNNFRRWWNDGQC